MSSIEAANLFGVEGLVAVITGGGTGIGLMMAKALEANGAKVYIIGRRQEVLEKAAKEAKNGKIIPIQGDVTSKADLSRIVDKINADDGFINVLIANSGITGPTLKDLKQNASLSEFRNFLWATDSQEFSNTYHVNTSAVFFSVVAFLELLDAGNKKGNVEQQSQVIATSSAGAYIRRPMAGFAYSTSKAAVIHLMKQLATALVPYNIRSNVVAPGLYPSEMSAGLIARTAATGGIPPSLVPIQRPGTAEDMAGITLYMTSRSGAYLNGSIIVTDGGRLCIVPSTY